MLVCFDPPASQPAVPTQPSNPNPNPPPSTTTHTHPHDLIPGDPSRRQGAAPPPGRGADEHAARGVHQRGVGAGDGPGARPRWGRAAPGAHLGRTGLGGGRWGRWGHTGGALRSIVWFFKWHIRESRVRGTIYRAGVSFPCCSKRFQCTPLHSTHPPDPNPTQPTNR